jgi:hypothetical protein
MPGYLLNKDSKVLCAHAGEAKPAVTVSKVKVDGKPAVAISALYTVSGCAMPPPPAGNGPCVTANFLSSAMKVMSNGQPLLLKDSASLCTPTATPLNVAKTQMKVKGK